tara:strand:+ start:228 stop:458 length:231 start_codon:yes stop_codon:yes gene_type:complete
MENVNEQNQRKLKFDNSEYLIDSLPEEAKQLITGLRAADAQTNMYEDTLKLIAVGKRKMVEDLKRILTDIEPITNG